jgi:hypothetical protein
LRPESLWSVASWLQIFHFALSWDNFRFAAFHFFAVQSCTWVVVEGSDEACGFDVGFGAGALD